MGERTIYDVGFHTGQDSAYYLARGFRVVAIEANPALVEEGQAKFAREIANGRLTLLNIGIAEAPGRLTFFVNPDKTEFSSFRPDIAARDTDRLQEIVVQTDTFASIIRRHGRPYYAKIDIEGFDRVAVASLRSLWWWQRPRYISIENGQPADLETIRRLGYKRFSRVNQAEVPTATIPAGSREGAMIEWTFPYSASGLFGEDLAWSTYDEVTAASAAYWSGPHHDPVANGWFDVHAAR